VPGAETYQGSLKPRLISVYLTAQGLSIGKTLIFGGEKPLDLGKGMVED
jgi:hypothetical protein